MLSLLDSVVSLQRLREYVFLQRTCDHFEIYVEADCSA